MFSSSHIIFKGNFIMNDIEALLHSQFLELERTPGVESIEMTPDIYRWTVVIAGFTGSPYEGGVFPLLFDSSDGFPDKLPKIMFICPMFHPNVDSLGFIRLDNFEDPVLQGINICGIVSFIHSIM